MPSLTSLLDSDAFNQRLFFPRGDVTPTPPGAVELEVHVGDALWHVRHHQRVARGATLLLFHGNGETVSDYDRAADDFAAAGANLAVADYPGYGRSTGSPSLRGIISGAPAIAQALASPELIVMGRSLGSACAAELFGRSTDSEARFIIESGFVDLAGLISRRGLEPPPAFAAEEQVVFAALPKLKRGRGRLLVLHGRDDAAIPAAEAQAAFDAATTEHKELVFVDGRGHNDVSLSPTYWSALERFVAQR